MLWLTAPRGPFSRKSGLQLLVEHFCGASVEFPDKNTWKTWLKPVQEKWYTRIADRVKERQEFYLKKFIELQGTRYIHIHRT